MAAVAPSSTNLLATPPSSSLHLSDEIVKNILKYLDFPSLCMSRGVCQQWKRIAFHVEDPETVVRRTAGVAVFGATEWKHHFGLDVADEPAVDLERLHAHFARFTRLPIENAMGFTLLTLPRDLSFNMLVQLTHRHSAGTAAKFNSICEGFTQKYGEDTIGHTTRVMLTNNVLNETRHKLFGDLRRLVYGLGARLPRALEVAMLCLTRFATTEQRLYGDNPWTYTLCSEIVMTTFHPNEILVGGFSSTGLRVINYWQDFNFERAHGVGAASDVL